MSGALRRTHWTPQPAAPADARSGLWSYSEGMSDADPSRTNGRAARPGRAVLPRKVLLVLAVVFSGVAVGSLVLVGVDLAIGRAAAGDLFISVLNGATAAVFWLWRSRGR